jgi:hypothetical protein
MKTIAARFDEGLFNVLAVVAQLEGTTVVDQIRLAVEAHLALKMSTGDLASRAEEALQEIDREAASKKAAIATLIGVVTDRESQPKPAPRRRSKSDPDAGPTDGEPRAQVIPIGFAPNRMGR